MIRLRLRKDEDKSIITFSKQKYLSHELRVAIKILMYLKEYFQNESADDVFLLLRQILQKKESQNTIDNHEKIIEQNPQEEEQQIMPTPTVKNQPEKAPEIKAVDEDISSDVANQLMANFL
ncbi:MAG: hypothetical protein ACRDCC_09890 [Culicoidibacterales bacterium]